jgi:hypothetical protein
MSSNLEFDLINEITDYNKLDLMTSFRNVKSHLGIAAAVTAYARVYMIQYKTLSGINLYNTDIDSIWLIKIYLQN